MNVIVVSDRSNFYIANNISKILGVENFIVEFDDDKKSVHLISNFKKNVSCCFVIHSIMCDMNNDYMRLLFIINFLKKHNVNEIICVIPYFGYSRYDKFLNEFGFVVENIRYLGVRDIVSIDIHNPDIIENFTYFHNVSVVENYIKNFIDNKYSIVFPDNGSIRRFNTFKDENNCVIINKTREYGSCYSSYRSGIIKGKDCCIVDDIIDTGTTIFNTTKILHDRDACSITWFVSHFVSKNKNKILEYAKNLKVKRVCVLDTCVENDFDDSNDILCIFPCSYILSDFLRKFL